MNNAACASFPFQIEKIMSSIGEGIDFSQEQQRISGSVPSSCVSEQSRGVASCEHIF